MPEAEPAKKREVVELVTLAEIARRVVDLGYAQTMTRERVSQLSKTDPAWPVPREDWKKLGPYFQIPWEPVEAYFRDRKPVHGVHRTKRAQSGETPSAERE